MSFEQSDDDGDAHLINTITDADGDWWESIGVNGTHIKMQIDTGATKSLMPYTVYRDMHCNHPIIKTASKFKWYTQHPIKVEGCVTLPTRYKTNALRYSTTSYM